MEYTLSKTRQMAFKIEFFSNLKRAYLLLGIRQTISTAKPRGTGNAAKLITWPWVKFLLIKDKHIIDSFTTPLSLVGPCELLNDADISNRQTFPCQTKVRRRTGPPLKVFKVFNVFKVFDFFSTFIWILPPQLTYMIYFICRLSKLSTDKYDNNLLWSQGSTYGYKWG